MCIIWLNETQAPMNNLGFFFANFKPNTMNKIYFLLFCALVSFQVFGQYRIHGNITDASTKNKISGANIFVEKTQEGTTSTTDGSFALQVANLPAKLTVSLLGYKTQIFDVSEENFRQMVNVALLSNTFNLSEINILSDAARARHNPIAFNSISSQVIETNLGDKPLPEIFNASPGVFASRDGGGSGDAILKIRGFNQENIAVLLNGIPINGAENGLVYWNNWMGLTEAASSIQVQRGIGASKVALNSVGGTVNIITKNPNPEKGGAISYQFTDYGNVKTTLSLNSGMLSNGWALSFLGSRSSGHGYIDATYVNGWGYFFNVSKELGSRQRLVLNLLGGPERHGQRRMKLSKDEINKFGTKYNKEWGSYNGKINNASENFYHKPHLSINHYLGMGDHNLLATSVYFSPGWGGGKWNDSFSYGPTIFAFRNPSGQIDWDAIYRRNALNNDNYTLENGSIVNGFSKVIQTNFLASHVWAGAVSTYETHINASTKVLSGIHYRYFRSQLRQEVADLLGGKFYIDDFGWSLSGVAGRNQIKMPGDIIRMNNGALLHQVSMFSQIEKKWEKVNLFAGLTLSNNSFRRHDIYNYPENMWSVWVHKAGYDLKSGVNYNVDDAQNIYVNAAHFSKAPYYKFIFGNFNNIPVNNINNENVNTIEAGYAFNNAGNSINISAYLTQWRDVSFLSNEYVQLENSTQTKAMVSGLNALHKGIEMESNISINEAINFGGFVSIGNWMWTNDVEAKLLNDKDVVVDTVNVFAKGLYVGGQPQFQAGLYGQAMVLKTLKIQFSLNFNDRHYAQFDATGRQSAADRSQAFRLPSSTLFHINIKYPIEMLNFNAVCFMGINNIFNQQVILNGEDGITHDMNTFKGFWAFGRTFDFGIKVAL